MGRGGPAASGILSRKAGLPPIVHGGARVLILGSLPGDASLAAAQYYAFPRNQFWTLLGRVIGCDLVAMEYSARIKAIDLAGVALWDVVCEAHRPASLDQKIRHVRLNDLRKFARQLPNLQAVAFNGKTAAALAGNAFDTLPLDILHLPSSSPAYTIGVETKSIKWDTLSRYLALEPAAANPI